MFAKIELMVKTFGLTSEQARSALLQNGFNEIAPKSSFLPWKLLISQFNNMLIILLFLASLLSLLIGDKIDGLLILGILILNGALGFWQEYKASKELEALRKMEVSTSRVIRDGRQQEIPTKEVVVGDLLVLEEGAKIGADATLLQTQDLSVNESSLTGESLPILKGLHPEDNQIYFGTVVVSGKGQAKVRATGANTRFGQIAKELTEIGKQPTTLEVALSSLAKKVGTAAFVIALALLGIRALQGETLVESLFVSIALMVAAVPEGLPAIITVTLALGVRRMYQKKTLVRKLSAIESLGACSLICTDKTGTLTKNEMEVRRVVIQKEDEKALLKVASINNSATLVLRKDHGFDILGDRSDGALLAWVKSKGVNLEEQKRAGKVIEEMPFDVKARLMAVLWQEGTQRTLYTKGAPEVILPLCNLGERERAKAAKEYENLAKEGLRVLAFAQKVAVSEDHIGEKNNLDFLGFVGIADAPRPQAKETILKARAAGIKIVMITGDNELTAQAIAKEVGLLEEGDEILTGGQLEKMDDQELDSRIGKIKIFARVFPEQKLTIIKSFQRSGEVVAVTGDGVNDALALKQANVGVAMGTGTDVAKEAGELVILDDNLSTIVQAVEQGRLVYSNILKIVKYLLTGNLSEVLLIVTAVLMGLPNPLLAVQILWINFVTDGFPALALAADSPSSKIMHSPPRPASQAMLTKDTIKFIFGFGSLIALVVLALFYLLLTFFGLQIARSYSFSAMVVLQMALVFAMRRHHTITSNKSLLLSVLAILAAQGLILYYPPLQALFKINSGW